MDYEIMHEEEKAKTHENGETVLDTPTSCEEHVFKKARFAWQIKGQLTAENNCSKGETSCVKAEQESDVVKDNARIENSVKNKFEAHSAISVIDGNDKNYKSDLVLIKSKADSISTDAKLNMSKMDSENSDASVSDLQSSKRKFSSGNHETDHNSSKRVKSLQSSCVEGQSVGGSSSSERFFNLQAGRATAASNPDFSRAITSILPNFPGLDLPSFIWQKQEMGCAIVDNVFNRTLEEMGLSPDPVVNMNASTRLILENRSIETAIRNQGLRANSSQSEEHRILNSMEEIQHNATMEDFEHTQNQISMIMTAAQSQSVNSDHMEGKAENGCAVVNEIDLNKVIIPATAGNHGQNDNEDNSKVRCDEDEIPLTARENFECIAMEDSDSSQCRSAAEKHSENVLDLAVSTAIINQGLTFESV